jgi:hypothetical protein
MQILSLLKDELLQNLLVLGHQKIIYLAVKLILNGTTNACKGLSAPHLLTEILLTQMHDGLLDTVLEYLIFAANVEVVQEMLLPLRDLVLLVYEVVHVLEVLVDVQLLPEHPRILHG